MYIIAEASRRTRKRIRTGKMCENAANCWKTLAICFDLFFWEKRKYKIFQHCIDLILQIRTHRHILCYYLIFSLVPQYFCTLKYCFTLYCIRGILFIIVVFSIIVTLFNIVEIFNMYCYKPFVLARSVLFSVVFLELNPRAL